MSTSFWFILSLLTPLVYSSGSFTNVCKQLTLKKVHVMAMGAVTGQQSFIILVDTLNYAKAHLNNLEISASSDATFKCTLKLSNETKVGQMIASIDKLREYLAKAITKKDYDFGLYTITIDSVDYFNVYLVLKKTTYQLSRRIDVQATASDDFKFSKTPIDFTGWNAVLSSAIPSVVYVLVANKGCLTKIKFKDDQINRAQDVTFQQFENELSGPYSKAKIFWGGHSFLNNAPTLDIEQSPTNLCISGSQEINGGYYDDKADVLMGFNNKHQKLYIYRNLKSNSNAPPVKVLNWAEFLVCPEGGSISLPPNFVPGIFDKPESNDWIDWLNVTLFIVVLILVTALVCIVVKKFKKKKKKKGNNAKDKEMATSKNSLSSAVTQKTISTPIKTSMASIESATHSPLE